MTLKLLEGALDALYACLSVGIEAKVGELNTRYADEYALTTPKEWYFGNLPHSMPARPSIALRGDNLTPRALRAENLHGASFIEVVVFDSDNNLEARFRRLCRYGLAVVELALAGEKAMGYTIKLLGPIAITDTARAEPFLQAIIVPITLEKIEDIGGS